MNTSEINDSLWPTSYYIASAVPLTIILVLLPLVALQLFDILVLKFITILRQAVKWTAIIIPILINIARISLNLLSAKTSVDGNFSVCLIIFTFCIPLCWITFYARYAAHSVQKRHNEGNEPLLRVAWAMIRECGWLSIYIVFPALFYFCCIMIDEIYYFIKLVPFVIYFIILGILWYGRNRWPQKSGH
jgi:hypothetical protein